jgi:hypothetical protein
MISPRFKQSYISRSTFSGVFLPFTCVAESSQGALDPSLSSQMTNGVNASVGFGEPTNRILDPPYRESLNMFPGDVGMAFTPLVTFDD